ncbi:MAG: YraN family protein [Dissulfurimicrobium sp.]|uniref:YraN family protein n=1 Tax=Dissulfurimicrobium sp. TaxID=2022436 RepID=UPI00404925A7
MKPIKTPLKTRYKYSSRNLGTIAEDVAAAFLSENGYTVLERNYITPYGEIDIILTIEDILVFVEVKARWGRSCGLPQEAVTLRKQRQILRTAQWYLQKKGWLDKEMRFDVLAINFLKDGYPEIEHITYAFDGTTIGN